MRKRIVLVGAGHAHLYIAAHAEKLAAADAETVLVDPGKFWYSGLATGMLGGMYSADDDQVDPQCLIEQHGGRFLQDRVQKLDLASRWLALASGEELSYDLLSFNIGSVSKTKGIDGADKHAWAVKPIGNLWKLREHLGQALPASGKPVRVLIIGGGATGCEIAANIDAFARRIRGECSVAISASSNRLLPRQPKGAGHWLLRHFQERSIEVRFDEHIVVLEHHRATTAKGERIDFDLAILATGLEPPSFFREQGLSVGSDGGLLVNEFLFSVDDERIFGTGDCISFCGKPLPRLGVFGVRESPILLHNLIASLNGQELRRYRPQKRWLTILNLGNGQALSTRGALYWPGRSSLWLKEKLDFGFLDKYH